MSFYIQSDCDLNELLKDLYHWKVYNKSHPDSKDYIISSPEYEFDLFLKKIFDES